MSRLARITKLNQDIAQALTQYKYVVIPDTVIVNAFRSDMIEHGEPNSPDTVICTDPLKAFEQWAGKAGYKTEPDAEQEGMRITRTH